VLQAVRALREAGHDGWSCDRVRIWLNNGKGRVMKEDWVSNESGESSSLCGIVRWESPCAREWIAPRMVQFFLPPIWELLLEAELMGLGLGLGLGVGDLWT
jgi:hypothetical protein